MNKEQALSVLVTAVKLANKRGSFELEESGLLLEAIKLLQPPAQPASPVSGKETTTKTTGTEQDIETPYPGDPNDCEGVDCDGIDK